MLWPLIVVSTCQPLSNSSVFRCDNNIFIAQFGLSSLHSSISILSNLVEHTLYWRYHQLPKLVNLLHIIGNRICPLRTEHSTSAEVQTLKFGKVRTLSSAGDRARSPIKVKRFSSPKMEQFGPMKIKVFRSIKIKTLRSIKLESFSSIKVKLLVRRDRKSATVKLSSSPRDPKRSK